MIKEFFMRDPRIDQNGNCVKCGGKIWDDNLAYGCSHCGWSYYGG